MWCGSDTLLCPGTCRGPPRRPPPHILDQVKSLNQSLRLGHLLCRSRNPDFLLNIIQRQASPTAPVLSGRAAERLPRAGEGADGGGGRGAGQWAGAGRCQPAGAERAVARQASSQSMPWLADLVQSSEGSLDVLPVQCLCEFLLHDAAADSPGEEEEEGESKEQKAKKRQVGAPAPPCPADPAGPP